MLLHYLVIEKEREIERERARCVLIFRSSIPGLNVSACTPQNPFSSVLFFPPFTHCTLCYSIRSPCSCDCRHRWIRTISKLAVSTLSILYLFTSDRVLALPKDSPSLSVLGTNTSSYWLLNQSSTYYNYVSRNNNKFDLIWKFNRIEMLKLWTHE